MAELDDLHLNEPAQQPPPPAPRAGPSLLIPGLIIAAIIGIGIGVAFWPRHAPEPETRAATPAAAPTYPVTSAAPPSAEPGENIPLPPLDETDTLVRQLVSQLSSHPRVAAWLATDGLLRNFAVVVTNVADGATPVKALAKQRPSEPFTVRTVGSSTFIDPASYHRYDAYADAVAGLDARGTARVYETLKPRIAEAYRDLGYPDGDVDAALTRAIIILLRTPRTGEDVAVTQTSVTWKYADPALESLPQAERQLLRMGPRNVRLIQDKLREIAPYLGIDPSKLPPS